MKSRFTFAVASWFLFHASECLAVTTNVSGSVFFDAIGKPSLMKIHGEGKELKGSLKQDGLNLSGEFSTKLETFETGIKLRDEHMKSKYLEIAQFPEARIKIMQLSLPSEFGEFKGVEFSGIMLLHGKEKTISGRADISTGVNTHKITADFAVKLSDFGISIPSFVGVIVAEEVRIKAILQNATQ